MRGGRLNIFLALNGEDFRKWTAMFRRDPENVFS